MRVFIVEDEAAALRRLMKMVHEADRHAFIAGTADSIESAVNWYNENEAPDLTLLDIELADGHSFEIFNKVKVPGFVIFTTAYDHYALKAFKVNSIDYLLKPVEEHDLKNAFQKYKNIVNTSNATIPNVDPVILNEIIEEFRGEKPKYKTRFLVKLGERLISVPKEDISYFVSEEKLVILITRNNKKYVIDQSLDELEKVLDPEIFFRINRQYIACMESIQMIHNYFNGKLKVVLEPETDKEVLISREKAPIFKMWLDR